MIGRGWQDELSQLPPGVTSPVVAMLAARVGGLDESRQAAAFGLAQDLAAVLRQAGEIKAKHFALAALRINQAIVDHLRAAPRGPGATVH